MKSTSVLTVSTDLYLIDDIILHPNEGFDLGLINPVTPVKFFANATVEAFNSSTGEFYNGHLLLKNQCKNGTAQLGKKIYKRLGMPAKIKLFYDQDKVLISIC